MILFLGRIEVRETEKMVNFLFEFYFNFWKFMVTWSVNLKLKPNAHLYHQNPAHFKKAVAWNAFTLLYIHINHKPLNNQKTPNFNVLHVFSPCQVFGVLLWTNKRLAYRSSWEVNIVANEYLSVSHVFTCLLFALCLHIWCVNTELFL